MSTKSSSNIRVSVTFAQPTVFAGEDVQATITFRNVAPTSPSRSPTISSLPTISERARKVSQVPLNNLPSSAIPLGSRNNSTPARGRGHRPTLSLSTTVGRPGNFSPPPIATGTSGGGGSPKPKHGRSVSIISINSEGGVGRQRGHARSASAQLARPAYSGRSTQQPSPLGQIESVELSGLPLSARTPSPNPSPGGPVNVRRSHAFRDFKFPARPPTPEGAEASPKVNPSLSRNHSPRPTEDLGDGNVGVRPPINRLLSNASITGGSTPRASTEIYSLSNHSDETLASEYPTSATVPRTPSLPFRPGHGRHGSSLRVPTREMRGPETLMMGYAQVTGSFTLDGSLVNQAPFEEVKRRGIVGSAGGGVVGLTQPSRNSGFFGSMGWSSIGSSLNNMLGGGEMSSIREMRGKAEKKDIPLLGTPQSILFVDLRLAPGESKSYAYTFTLPRGLPPTHKGRAIKVAYNLQISIQRPPNAGSAAFKSVEIPFRVLCSVNNRGEVLGHDLMTPYILLSSPARTASLASPSQLNLDTTPPSTEEDFHEYLTALLAQPGGDLLSPTEDTRLRRQSSLTELEPQSQAQAIDMAVLRSNALAPGSAHAPNRFEIARSGRRVAVIVLARPAYRLGEVVTGVVDLEKSEIPVYGFRAWLETSEKVDGTIALRSASSILRVTRKIYSNVTENTLWAKRVGFELAIPPSATPEFMTSGVSLEWKLRISFTTPSLSHLSRPPQRQVTGDDSEDIDVESEEEEPPFPDLLEEVSKDERGTVLVPVEKMKIDSFEVGISLHVYGAASAGGVEGEEVKTEIAL